MINTGQEVKYLLQNRKTNHKNHIFGSVAQYALNIIVHMVNNFLYYMITI